MTIGSRIADFRKTRGLSQAAFGAAKGVTKHTQLKYENDASSPNLEYLAGLHEDGADILYIVTGQKAPGLLSASETLVLDAFRALDGEEQHAVLVIIARMAGRSSRPSLHSRSEGYPAQGD